MGKATHAKTASTMRLIGLLGAVMMVTAASCSQKSPSPKPRLDIVGDSIAFESTADIHAHFDGHYRVKVTATFGFTTWRQQFAVAADAADPPAKEIIELGTNDAVRIDHPSPTGDGPPPTLADVTGRLDTFAREFPKSTCVIFVTVSTHNPTWSPANAHAIDDHIRSRFAHVADWDRAWKPSYFDTAGDPHPNESGRQALLALVDTALDDCPNG
jgi:hypothetical protein